MSHAAGVGPAFPREVVRAMLLLRANTLALGHSGCRPVAGRPPARLPRGRASTRSCPSRGASVRRATSRRWPISRCRSSVAARSSSRARSCRPWSPCARPASSRSTLEAKEGLALLNGTQMMGAIGALAPRRRRPPRPDGQRRRGDERRGAARDRRRVRRGLPARPAAPGPDRGRRRAPPPAPRQRAPDRPSRPRPQGPGPVLAALHPAGPRRGPRHARPPPARPRHRAQLGDRQPARLPRRRGRRRRRRWRPAAAG